MAKILVVDDNDALRSIIVDFLRMHGHECDEAATAAQARTRLVEKKFDLALSDLQMPCESGLDLLRYVVAGFPSTCFVLMSGSFDRDIRRRAMGMGALRCLSKPFKLTELLRIVQLLFPRLPTTQVRRRVVL